MNVIVERSSRNSTSRSGDRCRSALAASPTPRSPSRPSLTSWWFASTEPSSFSLALPTDLACSISWRAVQPHPTAFLIQHAFARSLSSWRRKVAWEIQLQAKSAAVKTWCQNHGDNVMTTAATCTSDSRARSPPPLTNSRRPTSDHKKGPRVPRGPGERLASHLLVTQRKKLLATSSNFYRGSP